MSDATDINDRGQVAGESLTVANESRAVVRQHGVITDLDTLGGRHSAAWAVSERGLVLGWAYPSSGRKHAAAWTTRR